MVHIDSYRCRALGWARRYPSVWIELPLSLSCHQKGLLTQIPFFILGI